MTLFERIFGAKKSTASEAKNRLTVMLAQERADNSFPFIDDLRRDIIEVIKKYTTVENVHISTEKNQNIDMLEVEITLGKNDKN
jgi:cell division topological specificity factor